MSSRIRAEQRQTHFPNLETLTPNQKKKTEKLELQSSGFFNQLPEDINNELLHWVMIGNLSGSDLRSLACTSKRWRWCVKEFLRSDRADPFNDRRKINLMLDSYHQRCYLREHNDFTKVTGIKSRLEGGLLRPTSNFRLSVNVCSDHSWSSKEVLNGFKCCASGAITMQVNFNPAAMRNAVNIACALPKDVLLRLVFREVPDDPKKLRNLFWKLRASERPIGIKFQSFDLMSSPELCDEVLDQMRGKSWLTDVQFDNLEEDPDLGTRKLAAVVGDIKYVKLVTISQIDPPSFDAVVLLLSALKKRRDDNMSKLIVAIDLPTSPEKFYKGTCLASSAELAEAESCGLIFVDSSTGHHFFRNIGKLRALMASERFEPYKGLKGIAFEDPADYSSEVELDSSDEFDTRSDEDPRAGRQSVAPVEIPEPEIAGERKGKKDRCIIS